MEEQPITNEELIVAGTHLSSFLKYFLPPLHLIVLLVVWVSYADKSARVERNAREALNFQISLLIITVGVALLTGLVIGGSLLAGGIELWENLDHSTGFPFAKHTSVFATIIVAGVLGGVVTLGLAVVDIVYSLRNAMLAKKGEAYHYPLSFNIISAPQPQTQAAV